MEHTMVTYSDTVRKIGQENGYDFQPPNFFGTLNKPVVDNGWYFMSVPVNSKLLDPARKEIDIFTATGVPVLQWVYAKPLKPPELFDLPVITWKDRAASWSAKATADTATFTGKVLWKVAETTAIVAYEILKLTAKVAYALLVFTVTKVLPMALKIAGVLILGMAMILLHAMCGSDPRVFAVTPSGWILVAEF